MSRRRDLIGAQEVEPPNKFIEGTYTRGTSAWSVDSSGNVTMTAWGSGSTDNRPIIQMVRGINFALGDTVRLVVTKISGSISINQFCDLWICGFKIANNATWKKDETAIDITDTATSAPSSTFFTMNNRTGTATLSSYKFKVEVYVNGTKVFPEV